MKRILSKTAFSLLELIIVSVLVVVVVLGIFSINSVLSNNSQDYGQRYLVKSATQATLNHILNNASLAIGSGTKDTPGNLDLGIQIGLGSGADPGVGDANSFCIHQDINPSPASQPLDSTTVNPTPGTPPSYPNSRWLCYTWYPKGYVNCPNGLVSCDYEIFYCAFNFIPAAIAAYPSTRGAASCSSSPAPSQGPLYLGTASGNPFSLATTSFNSTSGFSMTIQNCLDNSQASGNCGTPNNPSVQLSGSVFPSQVGN